MTITYLYNYIHFLLMHTFTVTYTVKYELSINPNYVWTEDSLCFNLKTGRRIKQVYKNGMIGYCIGGKLLI